MGWTHFTDKCDAYKTGIQWYYKQDEHGWPHYEGDRRKRSFLSRLLGLTGWMEFTQESCQAFACDESWACHIPMVKESSGFLGLWRWEHFSLQPFQRAYCLVGVGILKWFLIITWIIRKDSYYSLFLLPFLFFLHHVVAQGFLEDVLWFQNLYTIFLNVCFSLLTGWITSIFDLSPTRNSYSFDSFISFTRKYGNEPLYYHV